MNAYRNFATKITTTTKFYKKKQNRIYYVDVQCFVYSILYNTLHNILEVDGMRRKIAYTMHTEMLCMVKESNNINKYVRWCSILFLWKQKNERTKYTCLKFAFTEAHTRNQS